MGPSALSRAVDTSTGRCRRESSSTSVSSGLAGSRQTREVGHVGPPHQSGKGGTDPSKAVEDHVDCRHDSEGARRTRS